MENIQNYIESGILEQYALGELSAAEQTAVETLAAAHPEIRAELQQAQAALGFYAEAHAIAPPTEMRERVLRHVMAQIAAPAPTSALRADVDAVAQANPLTAAPAPPIAAPAPASGSGVRPLSSAPAMVPVSRPGSTWAIAASVALFLSLGANALLYSQWKDASADLVAMQDDQARFAATTQVTDRKLGALQQENDVLRNDEFRAVALAGTKDAPGARARVLFNPASHKVYLDVKNLPALPAGKQYQLWALDNGKPVDAGMLAVNTATGDDIQQMKDITSAQAFALTVEPTGGSAGPTLPIQAMGAVTI